MFGKISIEEIGTTRSGKRYRVDTKKRCCGQDPKLFIETDYSPLMSESEGEGNPPENSEGTSQYSPFQLESASKPKYS